MGGSVSMAQPRNQEQGPQEMVVQPQEGAPINWQPGTTVLPHSSSKGPTIRRPPAAAVEKRNGMIRSDTW